MVKLTRKLKRHHYRLSADLRFLLRAFLTLLAIQQLIRLSLIITFAHESFSLPFPVLAESIYLGTRFDIMLSSWICLPMVIACAFPASLRSRSLWRAWLSFMGLVTIAVGIISIMAYQIEGTSQGRSFYYWLAQGDQVPWSELLVRWETALWAMVFILFSGILFELIKASDFSCRNAGEEPWLKRLSVFSLLIIISLFAIRGTFHWGPPLKPEAAHFSSYFVANHIAANSTFTLSRQRIRMANEKPQ